MRGAGGLRRYVTQSMPWASVTGTGAHRWEAVRRIAGAPGPLDLFTSPGGLMAILYGRTGTKHSEASPSSSAAQSSPLWSSAQTAATPFQPPSAPEQHDDRSPPRDGSGVSSGRADGRGGGGAGGDNGQDEGDGIFARLRAVLRQEAVFLALVIVALSAIWEVLSGQKSVVFQHFKDMFTVTLEVRSSQEEYAMIMDWMGRHPRGQRAHNLTLKPITVAEDRSLRSSEAGGNRSDEARAVLVPGYGSHYFTHGKTRLWVSRSEDEFKKKNANGGYVDRENDILSITFLTRRRDVVESYLNDVRASWRTHVQNRVRIYANEQYSDSWKLLTERTRRPLSTLFLPPPILAIADEVRTFLRLQPVYAALGIPWRRGYLFEGPPGTGKTSLVMALAGEIGLPIYILSLQAHHLDDAALLSAVSCVPRRSILLIEDIENAIKTPGDAASGGSTTTVGGDGESGVSMSALLNALDGVASSEGRVLIITSNNPEALPSKEALLRPGRVDRRVEFSHMTEATQEEMTRAFLSRVKAVPHLSTGILQTLGERWEPGERGVADQPAAASPAVVQQRLLEAIFAAAQKEVSCESPAKE